MTAPTPRFTDYTGESAQAIGGKYQIWVWLEGHLDTVPLFGDLGSMAASRKLFDLRKAHPEHSYEMVRR